MTTVKYESNNSGGSFWLTDQNWLDLEAVGWAVKWVKDDPYLNGTSTGKYAMGSLLDKDGRYMRALAKSATREGLSMGSAIYEWENVTGQTSNELGCGCCGAPHSFSDDEGNYYTPDAGSYGPRYED